MKTLVGQLRGWQRREWLIRAVWGAARLGAIILVVLGIACLLDWFLDREDDTPFWFRVLMTGTQAVLYAVLAYFLILRLRVPSLDALASQAEEATPEFGHRLVTALQLNRPDARTSGMSKELIAAVTNEAETLSAHHQLASLADKSRLGMAAAVFLPVALIAAGFAAMNPTLTAALVARQALLDVEIPRPVQVKNITPELWPSGDEVELRFEVTGPVSEHATGKASVFPEGQPSEEFPLTQAGKTPDGATLFTGKLPPSSVPFTFRAKAAGGRTRRLANVRFEPRPAVKELSAWVLMPLYVDPEGKRRYERFQPQGEVIAYAGSAVRVEATATKPVKSAAVVVLSRDDNGQEQESARVPMTISPDGTVVSTQFELPPRPAAYRVELVDENGFTNVNPPRRGITLAPDEPPRVTLLSEVLKDPLEDGPFDDFEVNGMPLALGGQVQIGYAAKSPLGLSRAQILYRVNDGPWSPLPLAMTVANLSQVGKFVPELGVFERSGAFGQVEFYPFSSSNPETEPPGLEAGGRFNFQTSALEKRNEDGTSAKLEVGDRVEYLVEVFDRNPAPGRLPGRSESRIKAVVSESQLKAWLDQRDQSRDRLRQIEERQRGVFNKPKS